MVSWRRHAGLRRQLCIRMVMMNIQWNNNTSCINCYIDKVSHWRHDYWLCLSLTLQVNGVAMWHPYCQSLPWGKKSSGALDPLKGALGICESFIWKNDTYVRWYVSSVIYIIINNNVLSSFVFSLQYLHHKNKKNRINQLIIGISESVQDLILCRCICGYCNVLCMRNLNLIELFHRPHRVPQTIFPQLLNKSTFAWLLNEVVLLYTRNLYFIASF